MVGEKMEQKKLLWIIFSVTLFLVVVVGAGFIWFYPGETVEYTEKESQTPQKGGQTDFDPVEWVRTSEEYPKLKDEEKKKKEEGFVVVYGEDREKKSEKEKTAEKAEEKKQETTEPKVEETPLPEKEEKSETAVKPSSKKRKEQQEEKTYSGTKKTIRTAEYWIQAGSYTSKTRAEKVRERLNEKGFTGRVMAKEIDGTLYYRVRIGPYRKKGEADKFLTWVKDIKDFEKSYVSKVYRTKVVRE